MVSEFAGKISGYKTALGRYLVQDSLEWMKDEGAARYAGSVSLILTSPPFPLSRKKSYGNKVGNEYVDWISSFFQALIPLLAEDGSLVVEIGNSWNVGEPSMSTMPIEALLEIKKKSGLVLCQEFVVHNPARLPSPVQYVNVDRSRVKDSWTRVWWMSKTAHPKADNRKILLPYSKAMQDLLKRGTYNSGVRPSEHSIGGRSFLRNNGGAIPASCLTAAEVDHFGNMIVSANTKSCDPYLEYCRRNGVKPHPARMQEGLAKFFISFLTNEGDMVYDPFAGSNTTGYCCEVLVRKWLSTEVNYENMHSSMARFR